jgi:predicted enzyme related to lactoylglutathione lyase
MAVLNYVEMPVGSAGAAADFYARAFGWRFTDYGGEYAAEENGPCQIGLNATVDDRTQRILPVIEVSDIDVARAAVLRAGGHISRDIFAYPGGRRFHFADPDGLELGVYVKDAVSH